jgi:hypothetical protein
MCVKHHQDAYKLEVKTEAGSNPSRSSPSTPTSPLRMVQTGIVTIRESSEGHEDNNNQ